METQARDVLCQLVAQYGRPLCDEPRRCEALLRDLCGRHRQEVNLLLLALKEGTAKGLLQSSPGAPAEMAVARLSQALQDQLAVRADAARWAVESWALALGVWRPDPAAVRLPPSGSGNGAKAKAPSSAAAWLPQPGARPGQLPSAPPVRGAKVSAPGAPWPQAGPGQTFTWVDALIKAGDWLKLLVFVVVLLVPWIAPLLCLWLEKPTTTSTAREAARVREVVPQSAPVPKTLPN